MWVKHQPVLAMALRRGSVEMGLRRSEMKRRTYDAGEMSLVPRHLGIWSDCAPAFSAIASAARL